MARKVASIASNPAQASALQISLSLSNRERVIPALNSTNLATGAYAVRSYQSKLP